MLVAALPARIFFRGGKLYVDLVFAEEVSPLEQTGRSAGIDLPVNLRVALSDDTLVEGRTPDRGRVNRRAQLARETQSVAQPQRGAWADHGAGAALTTALPWRICGSRT